MSSGRRGRAVLAAVLVCAASIGISACGGDSDESAKPSAQQSEEIQALTDLGGTLTAAVADLDTEKLCSHLDPAVLNTQFKSRKQCAAVLKRSIVNIEEKPSFDFSEVTIDGDSAVAKTDGGTGDLYFRKIKNKWYVTAEEFAGARGDSPESQ